MTEPAATPRPRPGWRSAARLAAALAACFAVGWLGSLATAPNIPGWYAGLAKPAFTPPNWVFPLAWSLLYALMAFALWRALEAAPHGRRLRVILPFAVQLGLNLGWSWAFFGAQSPRAGMVVILILLAAMVWTVDTFAGVSRRAAWLMAPYFAWIAFAALLNGRIWAMNG